MASTGNTANLKHGRNTQRHGLVLGELGKRYAGIHNSAKHLRRVLENLVNATHGGISPEHARCIDLACRYQTTTLVCDRLIRDNQDAAGDQALTWLMKGNSAAARRNVMIERLGIDQAVEGDHGINWDLVMREE
jgi:hypothetical protein